MTETDVIILEKYVTHNWPIKRNYESSITVQQFILSPTAMFKWSYGGGCGKMTESSVKQATNSLFV